MYARGDKAWGECGRCGRRVYLKQLIEDGYTPGLMVERACWEPIYPFETLSAIDDPITLERPSPSLNKENGAVRLPNLNTDTNQTNNPFHIGVSLGQISITVT